MAEAARFEKPNIDPDLEELRLLTDVNHLLDAMQPDGSVPEDVEADVKTNLRTAVYEIAMPLAVSTTAHRVEYREDETGHRQRVITWLGKNAVRNAMNGKLYHRAPAAHKRVDVEVAEAEYAQDHLRPGVAQAFISPKMSALDAPQHIAKAEHLHAEDSLRVSYAITDKHGEVIARRLESLLVSDISLDDWVAMLKDPHNIFGKAFPIANEASALSVMELFKDMELPEEAVPEGPVTLVAAVLPYIKDEASRASVQHQLEGFRKDQALYEVQAERTATEWLAYDKELARSLQTGQATYAIKRSIAVLQHEWGEEDLRIINNHHWQDGEYIMTTQLAAVLERAKQNILGSKAALATNNEKVLGQVDSITARALQDSLEFLEIAHRNGATAQQIARLQAEIDRRVARQNFRVGGGCPGESQANFRNPSDPLEPGMEADQLPESDKKNWKWKLGKCQVKSCPSPKPTEVGPCSVCRRCQAKFDAGDDPTKEGFLQSLVQPNEGGSTFLAAVLAGAERSKPEPPSEEANIAKQADEIFTEEDEAVMQAHEESSRPRQEKVRSLSQFALAS
jgi:hypothetical protein